MFAYFHGVNGQSKATKVILLNAESVTLSQPAIKGKLKSHA